jgi:transposase
VLFKWARLWWSEEGREVSWQNLLPPRGFRVLPRRWIVERTFAWPGRNRRLANDYEARPQTTEVLMAVAMIGPMLRRLTRRC